MRILPQNAVVLPGYGTVALAAVQPTLTGNCVRRLKGERFFLCTMMPIRDDKRDAESIVASNITICLPYHPLWLACVKSGVLSQREQPELKNSLPEE